MKPNVNFYCLNFVVCLCYIVLYVGTLLHCFFVFNRVMLFGGTVLYYMHDAQLFLLPTCLPPTEHPLHRVVTVGLGSTLLTECYTLILV